MFNYFKNNKFMEANSFRDTDYYSAKQQAEVYLYKLEYYNEGKITYKRDYKKA